MLDEVRKYADKYFSDLEALSGNKEVRDIAMRFFEKLVRPYYKKHGIDVNVVTNQFNENVRNTPKSLKVVLHAFVLRRPSVRQLKPETAWALSCFFDKRLYNAMIKLMLFRDQYPGKPLTFKFLYDCQVPGIAELSAKQLDRFIKLDTQASSPIPSVVLFEEARLSYSNFVKTILKGGLSEEQLNVLAKDLPRSRLVVSSDRIYFCHIGGRAGKKIGIRLKYLRGLDCSVNPLFIGGNFYLIFEPLDIAASARTEFRKFDEKTYQLIKANPYSDFVEMLKNKDNSEIQIREFFHKLPVVTDFVPAGGEIVFNRNNLWTVLKNVNWRNRRIKITPFNAGNSFYLMFEPLGSAEKIKPAFRRFRAIANGGLVHADLASEFFAGNAKIYAAFGRITQDQCIPYEVKNELIKYLPEMTKTVSESGWLSFGEVKAGVWMRSREYKGKQVRITPYFLCGSFFLKLEHFDEKNKARVQFRVYDPGCAVGFREEHPYVAFGKILSDEKISSERKRHYFESLPCLRELASGSGFFSFGNIYIN
ncbi:MAG TPA: hypothetical protein PLU24_05225, partial [Candidatus Omnitrophota bacterium]|nr:hypothetical protein [Candidatus Omnitrophota bacterium]